MPPTSEPDPTKGERRAAAGKARDERELRIYDRYAESSERQQRSNARLAAIGWSVATTALLVTWAVVKDFASDWPLLPWMAICFIAMISSFYAWWRLSQRQSVDPAVLAAQREDRRQLRAAAEAHDRRLAARRPLWTYVLVGVIGIVSAVEGLTLPDSVERAALVKEATRAGEWWRIVTASFMHGSVWHLYFNLVSLVAIRRFVEQMPRPLDEFIRDGIARQLSGRVEVARNRGSADALLTVHLEEQKGGAVSGAGRLLGLKDKTRITTKVLDRVTRSVVWMQETGDRKAIVGAFQSDTSKRLAARLVKDLKDAIH